MTLGSDLTLVTWRSLTVRNGLTLSNVKLTLNHTATVFNGSGAQTLSGAGEVVFAGTPTALSYLKARATTPPRARQLLTIGGQHPGAWQPKREPRGGFSQDRIINAGTISAERQPHDHPRRELQQTAGCSRRSTEGSSPLAGF